MSQELFPKVNPALKAGYPTTTLYYNLVEEIRSTKKATRRKIYLKKNYSHVGLHLVK